jgi:hypothetical protein
VNSPVPGALASTSAFDSLCVALLRNDPFSWPFAQDEETIGRFGQRAIFHGVEALVFEYLNQLPTCPKALLEHFRLLASERAAWELRNRELMRTVFKAFAAARIDNLVYKGTALAYSLYDNPVWRSRGDSDVLVAAGQLQQARALLLDQGWRQATSDEEVIWYKWYFSKQAPEGGEHHIDLHWRLNNSELLAGLFTLDELLARSVSLPALVPEARIPGAIDALLIACLHRGVHKQSVYTAGDITEFTGDRLIWLKDIDLLARCLLTEEWDQFLQRAKDKGLGQICEESLALVHDCLATPLPAGWHAKLRSTVPARPDLYLAAGSLRRVWLDLSACKGSWEKLRFCRQLLFPSPAYMRNKYAGRGWQFLPWLYLRRMMGGAIQRISRDSWRS